MQFTNNKLWDPGTWRFPSKYIVKVVSYSSKGLCENWKKCQLLCKGFRFNLKKQWKKERTLEKGSSAIGCRDFPVQDELSSTLRHILCSYQLERSYKKNELVGDVQFPQMIKNLVRISLLRRKKPFFCSCMQFTHFENKLPLHSQDQLERKIPVHCIFLIYLAGLVFRNNYHNSVWRQFKKAKLSF